MTDQIPGSKILLIYPFSAKTKNVNVILMAIYVMTYFIEQPSIYREKTENTKEFLKRKTRKKIDYLYYVLSPSQNFLHHYITLN